MSNITEKITDSVIGGLIGFALFYLIQSFSVSLLFNLDNSLFVAFLMTLSGALLALFIKESKNLYKLKQNNERQNERISLFAHEMRTGQTSTSWAIELILKNYKDTLKDIDKSMLEGVLVSVQSAVRQSTNLLAVTLLDVNRLSIVLQWVPSIKIQKMFEETVANYILGAKEKNIELTSSITLDKDIKIEVDITRLRIILENLLENAIQYTTRDRKQINVIVHNDSSNLHLTVRDSGIGIPLNEQQNIFKEFYRAKNAKKNLSSGSGIGLYLCAQYVKAHHGTIRFESVENEGTTFYITIPIKSTADVEGFLNNM